MVGLDACAAHGDERVGRGAVELAVAAPGGVVGGRGVLAVDAAAGEQGSGLEDAVLRSVHDPDVVALHHVKDLAAAHRNADGDAAIVGAGVTRAGSSSPASRAR